MEGYSHSSSLLQLSLQSLVRESGSASLPPHSFSYLPNNLKVGTGTVFSDTAPASAPEPHIFSHGSSSHLLTCFIRPEVVVFILSA